MKQCGIGARTQFHIFDDTVCNELSLEYKPGKYKERCCKLKRMNK